VWNQQCPYGYVVDEHGRLKPHPGEAPIVRRMKDDFLRGASLRGVARWLNDEGIKPTTDASPSSSGIALIDRTLWCATA
jgi:hypothetical protein